MTPYWLLYIEMVIAPAAMIAALVTPIMALAALVFRRFHVTALVGVAACAVLLFAYAGLEAYWAALPPDDFPDNWFTSPGLDAAPPSHN